MSAYLQPVLSHPVSHPCPPPPHPRYGLSDWAKRAGGKGAGTNLVGHDWLLLRAALS